MPAQKALSILRHPGAILPDFILHRVFVAVKTMLILLQSEQQMTPAPAFRPMTCYHFVTRFHFLLLTSLKSPKSLLRKLSDHDSEESG